MFVQLKYCIIFCFTKMVTCNDVLNDHNSYGIFRVRITSYITRILCIFGKLSETALRKIHVLLLQKKLVSYVVNDSTHDIFQPHHLILDRHWFVYNLDIILSKHWKTRILTNHWCQIRKLNKKQIHQSMSYHNPKAK